MTASRAVPWDGPPPTVGTELPGGWVVTEVRPGGFVPAVPVPGRTIAYAVASAFGTGLVVWPLAFWWVAR